MVLASLSGSSLELLRRPLQKTLWHRQCWDPLDLSHLRTNFVLCSAAATGIQACVDYCRCWRGKRLCWLTPAGLAREPADPWRVHRAHGPERGQSPKPRPAGPSGRSGRAAFPWLPRPPHPALQGFFFFCTAGGSLTTHPWASPYRIKSVCI